MIFKGFGKKFNRCSKDSGKDWNYVLREWVGNSTDFPKIKDLVKVLFGFQRNVKGFCQEFMYYPWDLVKVFQIFFFMGKDFNGFP